MRKLGKRSCSKTKLGFTMMELLGVVAIMIVLFAVGVPATKAIMDRLDWKKANGIAKEIYMVAENQAIHVKSNNSLDSLEEAFISASSNSMMKVAAAPTDYPKDSTTNKAKETYKNLYCFSGDAAGPISYLIPKVTRDTIDGGYIVEANPATGDIYSIFFSEDLTSSQLFAAYKEKTQSGADNFRYTDDNGKVKVVEWEDSKGNDVKVGYISSNDSAGLSMDSNEVKMTAYNDEQLYVKVNIPGAKYATAFAAAGESNSSDFKVEFILMDEHGHKIIRSGNKANTNNTDINKPIFVQNTDSGTNGSIDAYLILDDSLNSTGTNFTTLNKGLTAGDDITIYAQACYIYTDPFSHEKKYLTTQLDSTTNAVTVNSLFADGTEISDDPAKTTTIKIANCRQLLNLRSFRNDSAWAMTDAGREIRTKQKVLIDQTADIDFAKLSSHSTVTACICPVFKANGTVSASDGAADCSLNFVDPAGYDTITNIYLFGTNESTWTTGNAGDGFSYSNPNNTYDGHGNEIQNLIINSWAATGSGLFGKFNAIVRDVHLRNIKVTSRSTRADGRRYVGALVGWAGSSAKIIDCGAYCTAYKEQSKYTYNTSLYNKFDYANYYIEGRGDVGGLVGRMINGATMENSFAAIDVKVESGLTSAVIQADKAPCNGFGGLVGRVLGGSSTIKNCYCSGKVTGTFDTGGIVGVCNGKLQNCYTTSIVKPTYRYKNTDGTYSMSSGGIAGKIESSGSLSYCNFYGSFEKFENSIEWSKENVGAMSARSSAESAKSRISNCKCLVMDGYNDDFDEDAYVGATKCEYEDAGIKANNSADDSFGYREDISNKAFPFNFISTIGYHYGNWPKIKVKPSLAYFEIYHNSAKEYAGIGFQAAASAGYPSLLDQDTLDKKGWHVYEAGYGMLKSGNEDVTLKIRLNGGSEKSLSLKPTKTIDLNEEEKASLYSFNGTEYGNNKKKSGAFYDTIVVDGTTYYYNCDVAKQAKSTSTTPSAVEIRTAKQFNNLGGYNYLWQKINDTKISYSQTLDINYETYLDGNNELNEANTPIGTSGAAFTNNYNGYGNEIIGYNLDSTVSFDNKAIGVFGSVGADVVINNVHLVSSVISSNPTGYIHASYAKNQDCSTGGLVGYLQKNATVQNCTISGYSVAAISTGGVQTGYVTVGGLIGTSYGTVTCCSSVNKEVRITTDTTYGVGSIRGLGITDALLVASGILDKEIVGIGGLVGAYRYGTLNYSYAGGTLNLDMTPSTKAFAADSYVAGIAGTTINIFGVDADTYRTATNCYSYCSFDIPEHSRNILNAGGYYQHVYGGGPVCDLDNCYYTTDTASTAISDIDFVANATALTLQQLAELGEASLRPSAANTHPWTEELKDSPYPNMSWVKAGNGNGSPVHYGDWPSGSGSTTPTPTPTPGAKQDQAAPDAPSAASKTKTSITLNPASGGGGHGEAVYAYSETSTAPALDSGEWTTDREFVFDDATPGKTYWFFAMYVGDDEYNPSPISAGTAISLSKNTQTCPAPTVADGGNKTGTSVKLKAIAAGQGATTYAKSTSNSAPSSGWTDKLEFTTEPNTTYYFFARYAGNDSYDAAVSTGTKVTTPKASQKKPVVQIVSSASNMGSTTVTLKTSASPDYSGVSIKYAYRKTGSSDSLVWKDPASISGLDPVTSYDFYAKFTGTTQYNESVSDKLTATTPKAYQNAPSAPSEASKTAYSITVNAVSAGQGDTLYAINTTNAAPASGWQTNTTFTELYANTTYFVFAMYAGNDKYYPSQVSSEATIKTLLMNYVGSAKIYERDGEAYAYLQFYEVTANGTIDHTLKTRKIPRGNPEYNSIVGPKLSGDTLKYLGDAYYFFWNVEDNRKWRYKKRVGSESGLPSNNGSDGTTSIGYVTYKYNGTTVGTTIKW